MDGSYSAWASSVPHRGVSGYGRVEVSRSGLEDGAAADLSAGRSVFLPWIRPKSAADHGLSRAGRTPVTALRDLSVFVASHPSASLAGLTGWLRAEGASVGFDGNLPRALTEVARYPGRWSALILHADGFGDLEDLVDRLLPFRRAVPALPLILISAGFGRDTLGTERLALCDVSLRDPIGLGRMRPALEQAVLNNQAWQERLAAQTQKTPPAPQPLCSATPRHAISQRP